MGMFSEITRMLREQGMAGEGMASTRKLEGVTDKLYKVTRGMLQRLLPVHDLRRPHLPGDPRRALLPGNLRPLLPALPGRENIPGKRISLLDGIFIARHDRHHRLLHHRVPDPGGPYRRDHPDRMDVIFGWFLIILSLEMARRTVGNVIPTIGIVLVVYAYFGPYFPLGLGHSGFSLARIAESLFLTRRRHPRHDLQHLRLLHRHLRHPRGIHGGLRLRQGLRRSGLRHYRQDDRGPGLASVITSALFGTVSGSAVANVVVDGVFTIPLMKRLGYPSHFAGAVEAAASTGGQYMPPVMGAAAFLLAEISGTPYVEVIKVAAIPACLYFASVGVIIYMEAVKRGLKGHAGLRIAPVPGPDAVGPHAPADPHPDRFPGPRHHPLHRRLLHHRRDRGSELASERHPHGAEEDLRSAHRGGQGHWQ